MTYNTKVSFLGFLPLFGTTYLKKVHSLVHLA